MMQICFSVFSQNFVITGKKIASFSQTVWFGNNSDPKEQIIVHISQVRARQPKLNC